MNKEDFGRPYELRLESKVSGNAALTQEDLNTLIADAFAKAGESEVLAEEVRVRSQRPFPVTGGAVFLVWFRKAIASTSSSDVCFLDLRNDSQSGGPKSHS